MFLLQAPPTPDDLRRFKTRYPELDPGSVALFLRVLSCGSMALLALDAFLKGYDLSHGRWITSILLQRGATPQTRLSTLVEQQGVTKATTWAGGLTSLAATCHANQSGRGYHSAQDHRAAMMG